MDALVSSLRELAARATKAPWFYTAPVQERNGHVLRDAPNGNVLVWGQRYSEVDDPNFLLLCALRNSLDALLARIEAGQRLRDAIRATTTHPCKASETELADALRAYDATMRGPGNDPRPT